MCNPAIKSTAMVMALMTSLGATGAQVYDFAAGFNGTLVPDVQPAGSAGPVVTGTGAAVSSSTYKYGTGSLQVQAAATGTVQYDWSKVSMTSWGTVGFWYNPSYTPSAATGTNTLFQTVAAATDGWVSGVSAARTDSTLTLSLSWDNNFSYNSVSADISNWTAGDWHYLSFQWARAGDTYLATYVDGTRVGYTVIGWSESLYKTMTTLYVGGNASGSFTGADGYLDGFSYVGDAAPWNATCAVPTTDVPEPALATILALGGLVVLRRRRC